MKTIAAIALTAGLALGIAPAAHADEVAAEAVAPPKPALVLEKTVKYEDVWCNDYNWTYNKVYVDWKLVDNQWVLDTAGERAVYGGDWRQRRSTKAEQARGAILDICDKKAFKKLEKKASKASHKSSKLKWRTGRSSGHHTYKGRGVYCFEALNRTGKKVKGTKAGHWLVYCTNGTKRSEPRSSLNGL